MIVYGKNAVREALSGDDVIEKVLIEKGNFDKALNDIVKLAKERRAVLQFVDKGALTQKAGTSNHQANLTTARLTIYWSLPGQKAKGRSW